MFDFMPLTQPHSGCEEYLRGRQEGWDWPLVGKWQWCGFPRYVQPAYFQTSKFLYLFDNQSLPIYPVVQVLCIMPDPTSGAIHFRLWEGRNLNLTPVGRSLDPDA